MSAQDDGDLVKRARDKAYASLITTAGKLGVFALYVGVSILIVMLAVVLVWGFIDIPDKDHIFATIVQWLVIGLAVGLGFMLVALLIGIVILVLKKFVLHDDDDDDRRAINTPASSSPLRISESASPHGLNPPAPIEAQVRNADEDVTVVSPKRPIGQR